jgi:Cytosol aminopeptidase family, N-terminal domain
MRPLLIALSLLLLCAHAHADSAAAIGTDAEIGELEGLHVHVKVAGPHAHVVPLQIACVFEYTKDDLRAPPALPPAANGMVHLDEALGGLITELRQSGKFAGHALETLLITPPKGRIAAGRLLLIGLGDRHAFSLALMAQVGAVGMREALRLGVTEYAHASDLKDAGLDSPTGAVARAVVSGAIAALSTERAMSERGMAPQPTVHALTLLAGPAFFADTRAAIRAAIDVAAAPRK